MDENKPEKSDYDDYQHSNIKLQHHKYYASWEEIMESMKTPNDRDLLKKKKRDKFNRMTPED